MTSQTVIDTCAEFRIKIVGGRGYPGPHQTRASWTLDKILTDHGPAHLRLVIMTLADTENNAGHLDRHLFMATSRLCLICADHIERDPVRWLECWDALPLGQLQWIARDVAKHGRIADALLGMIYERIYRAFGPPAEQPDLFDDRREP